MTAERRLHPDLTVAQIKAKYDQMIRALDARRNVERLKRLCGDDRVHYRVCDVLDRERTAAVVEEILRRHGHIDLLINAVVELRSRDLRAKSLADFRKVRDTKVTSYRNLKRALAQSPPRIWCNFSTMGTIILALGDVDYVSGSEYLNYATLRAHLEASDQRTEFAILWSAWRSVGSVSTPEAEETLERIGINAWITPHQGSAQFLSALTHLPRDPVLFFAREDERALLEKRGLGEGRKPSAARLPSAPPPAAPGAGGGLGPLLDGALMRGRTWAVFTKTWHPSSLSSEDGRWLQHHQVNGACVLPGTFALEAAAEAALELCPALRVVGFRNLLCHTSVTVHAQGQPRIIKIEARITAAVEDEQSATVAVRITTNRVSSTGKVLRFDDVCHEVDVLVSARHRDLGPPPDFGPQEPCPPESVPMYQPNRVIHLSGPFASTHQHTRGRRTAAARFTLDSRALSSVFRRMIIPALLLDAMGHPLTLLQDDERSLQIGPLAGFTAVDLATTDNDLSLAASHTSLRLHCDGVTGTLTAMTDDGSVLATIVGITAHPIATLDPHRHLIPRPTGARGD